MPEPQEDSRIQTDVDFDRDGKQIGRLRVPQPRNTSAWGMILVPVVCIKNGAGPTILMTAGAHGDEYEGPITLSKLAREIEPSDIRGRLILVPGMNVPGLGKSVRICPADGRDLNRTFPGRRGGSYTEMVTHFISTQLVPRADVVVDFHSGGYSLDFSPCIIIHHLPDPKMRERSLEALKAFGAPLGMVLRELDDEGTLDTFVENRGTLFLTTELAGGGQVSAPAVRVAHRGTWNLLVHFGLTPEDHPKVPKDHRPTEPLVEVPHTDCYVTAPEDGVFEPFFELGDRAVDGEPIGQLHFLTQPERTPIALVAGHTGTIICKRAPGLTEAGDCLAVIASPYAG